VARWPTPNAGLEKHSTQTAYWENRIAKGRQNDIQMAVYRETGSGQLNPTWVEWLMGYPLGWTALEGWATRSSRSARSKYSAPSKRRKPRGESPK
jgi:hypothetical protein